MAEHGNGRSPGDVPLAGRFRDLKSCQVIFTNPLEVAKIFAVQGESIRTGAHEGEQLEKQLSPRVKAARSSATGGMRRWMWRIG